MFTCTNEFILRILLIGYFALFSFTIQAQVYTQKKDTAVINALNKRAESTILDGIYIPKDLAEAHKELDKAMDPSAINTFKAFTEEEARSKTHFSFGRWMLTRWSLEDGSRLRVWFMSKKIYNPDDMVDCLITTYHRKLNGKDLDFENLAEYYFLKRSKEAQENSKKAKQKALEKTKSTKNKAQQPTKKK